MMTERLKSGVGRRKGQEEELMTLGWSIQYDTVRVRAEQRTGIWVCLLLPAQCPEDNWVLYICECIPSESIEIPQPCPSDERQGTARSA